MMTHRGSARSPLWNYLNLDGLTHSSPHWYDIDFDTARRTHHPSALRPEHSVTAYLNSRKHFIQYNLNPEPHELLSPSSAHFFVLSTDLPFLFNNTIAPRDFGKAAFDPRPVSVPTDPDAEPLGLYARNFKVNDLVQQTNWNSSYILPASQDAPFRLPPQGYAPERSFHYPQLYSSRCHPRNRHLAHRYHLLINQSYLNNDPPPLYFPSLWKRADQSSCCFHDSTPPPCSPRECPNFPKCNHFPWTSDTHTGTPSGEQLYDFCLLPTALIYSDLRPSSRRPALTDHQLLPDPFYADHTLPSSRDITSFIPLSLIKPEIHSVYHCDDDEATPCPIAIPCLEMVYSHQIDLRDRRIHYHYLPLDYHSVLGTEDEPQFILETFHVCSHFEDIRSLLFDSPTQYHSRLDFIIRDKVLEIIDYRDGRQAFINVNRSPDDLPTYYLPCSRFHLPTRREIFELHPEVFDHPSFLRSQFMSEDDEHDRRFSSDSAMIEISTDSDSHHDSHHVASLVHSLSESPASSDLISNPLARNSPARSFLDKLFMEQQKIPDSDPLILIPSRDLKAQSIVDALLVHIYSIFVAPKAIHSDNGPEFANQIFSLFCSYLNVEHSLSIPHFHQSNGLVERQHRTFLQALRKLLLDFSDYDNWSHYVPICQMIINSQPRSSLRHSPYQLIFGTDCSPLIERLTQSWKSISAAPKNDPVPNTLKYSPQVNDRVFVLREKPDKLHGHYVGPYTVQKILSPSSILVLNPVTRSSLKTSLHLIKPCYSSLPPAVLNAYAAADSGEPFLDAILDISSNLATVLWSDGTTTKQPVSSIKNTSTYSHYVKLSDPPAPKQRKRKKKRQC
ncbi:hypothetical protein P9112_006903 [Eukaryota sp. TZLM1-RC]